MNRSFLPRGILRNAKDFYNREIELNRIYGLLENLLCVNVFGQRRIGKSWLLRKIYLDDTSRPESLKNAIFIYWDLQDQQNLTVQQFMNRLIGLTLSKLPLEFRQSYEQIVGAQPNPDDHWNSLVELLSTKYRIVYLLDEFDKIINSKEFEPSSFSLTRNIFQSVDNEASTFVVSTYRAIADTGLGGHGSPFFNIFNKVGVGLFSEWNAQQFIVETFNQKGIAITEDGLKQILEMTGFHPCFISQLCDELQSQYVGRSMKSVDIQQVEDLANAFYTLIIDDYRYYWQHLNPRQKYFIQDIAMGKELNQDDFSFSNLKNLSLVFSKNGEYKLFSKLFKKFVQNEHSSGIPIMTDSDELKERYVMLDEEIASSVNSKIAKAKHKYMPNRLMAIKSLSVKGISEERLIREANIIAKLKHSNIAEIHDLILNPVRLVMEWIDGDSLQIYTGEGAKEKLPESEILKIGIKLADVLVYVHNEGVIHRDLKPSNIILRQRDDPVLIDFDIAKATDQITVSFSRSGEPGYIGTPHYSSPEQWIDPGAISAATDIFSLGVIMYELYTGVRPFEDGNHPFEYGGQLPIPDKRAVPEPVYTIICQCLRQLPKDRPSAEILKALLVQYQTQIGE